LYFSGIDLLSRSVTPGEKQARVAFADTFPRELGRVTAPSALPEILWVPQPQGMAPDGLPPSLPFAGHEASP